MDFPGKKEVTPYGVNFSRKTFNFKIEWAPFVYTNFLGAGARYLNREQLRWFVASRGIVQKWARRPCNVIKWQQTLVENVHGAFVPPHFLMDQHHFSNFSRGSLDNHLYQFTMKSNHRFRRRRFLKFSIEQHRTKCPPPAGPHFLTDWVNFSNLGRESLDDHLFQWVM